MARFASGQTGIRQIIRGYVGTVNGANVISIPPVTMSKAVVNHNGANGNGGANSYTEGSMLLTSPTTLTIYMNAGAFPVAYEIVEYF